MKTRRCCFVGVVGTLAALVPVYGQGPDRNPLPRRGGSETAGVITGPSEHLRSVIAAGPTMRIRLTPVPSQGPGSYPPGWYISGQMLHAPSGGFRAFFNVQLKDWDPLGNGPLLRGWQTKVDATGFLGAYAMPAQAGCDMVQAVQGCPSANAAGHAACAAAFGETGTLCAGSPLRCAWAFTNRTRADWVHLAEEPNVIADWNLINPIAFGLCTAAGVGSTDGGLLYYGGTMIVDIPACAIGQYTIPFVVAETFAFDAAEPLNNSIPILELVAAVVDIAPLPPECTTNADCVDLDPCTTDTCTPGLTCVHTPIPGCAPPQTGITYQGYLEKPAGTPLTQTCDLRFGLFDAATGGNPQGASPQTASAVPVLNGSFTAIMDFGAGAFNGDPRWLGIEVKCPGDASFVALSPRVELTPAPYAIRALEGIGGPNALSVTPDGKVGIGTTTPTHPLEMGSGAHCTTGGIWTDASDRNAKENFRPLDRGLVLEQLADLDVARWNYKAENPSVQHIGPVAQDFHALFGLGTDDKHLAALDTAGVALAAIQGLYEIVQERDCEIAELREKIDKLDAVIKALTAPSAGGGR